MLLALDVGNTNVTIGLFAGRGLARQWRVETAQALRPGRLAAVLRKAGRGVSAVVYGSVVPSLDRALEETVLKAFGVRALKVGPASRLGVRLKVRQPRQVGADRILNALAAARMARGAAVVVDFGTATTFDCVSASGDYLGGAILPGPRMAARSLGEGTAKLPLVAVRRPRRVIGKTTVECIEAGVYFGYLGMIEKLLKLTLKEMRGEGHGPRIRVLATGGLAALFVSDLPRGCRIVPDLTLQGLRIAHEILTGGKP
jgi:type III pantothenate kinase